MASMKQESEGKRPSGLGQAGKPLFQSKAALSTSALAWRGSGDPRIPLSILTPHDMCDVEKAQSAVFFVGAVPVEDAGWLVSRVWVGQIRQASDMLHPGSCPCCIRLNGLGHALVALFQERVKGLCKYFSNLVIICSAEERALVQENLARDNLVIGFYGLKAVSSRFSCQS
ncbi:hypothetical protein [Acetobacter cibinongensis]|uniref:hypothetical protein n=1 Tax=Acetobacter cibinongensis TaxID=146475 RepID=UPI000662C302|nr:hypothetical protein [Acetobacter cibinongensis]